MEVEGFEKIIKELNIIRMNPMLHWNRMDLEKATNLNDERYSEKPDKTVIAYDIYYIVTEDNTESFTLYYTSDKACYIETSVVRKDLILVNSFNDVKDAILKGVDYAQDNVAEWIVDTHSHAILKKVAERCYNLFRDSDWDFVEKRKG